MDINDALYHAVHDYKGGVNALAARMGVAASTLYSMANPNDPSHPWPMQRALQVMSFTADQRVIQALCEQAGGVFVPVSPAAPMADLAQRMVSLSAEFGDVARAVGDAVTDGKLTPRERDRAHAQLYELISAAAQLGQGLDAEVAAQQPVRRVK